MPIITEHHVNFYDTDAMAVVHHSNYIRWFETGRVAYLRKYGITLGEMMEDGYVFPITEVRAKYVSPGRFDDDICIETRPKALTKAKMAFQYRVFNKATGELMVTGFIVRGPRTLKMFLIPISLQNVFTHRESGKITRLPEKYYAKLQQAMADEADWQEMQAKEAQGTASRRK